MKKIDNEKNKLIDKLKIIGIKHSIWNVFMDWVAIMAISISNVCDKVHYDEREREYFNIISKYNREELEQLKNAFHCLISIMDVAFISEGPRDILGEIFHELELHNKYKGQFFTPINISELMGTMAFGNDERSSIKEKGYFTVNEPACGSGVMVLGLARVAAKNNVNYNTQMCVLANDIDIKCTHIAYVQLSLYSIPAIVTHGDTIQVKEWSRWYTPLYLFDNWAWKAPLSMLTGRNSDIEMMKYWLEPKYGFISHLHNK